MFCILLQFIEVDSIYEEILRQKEEQDRSLPERHLYRLHHMNMWTKLRPGIWNFLEKVCCVFFSRKKMGDFSVSALMLFFDVSVALL